MKKIMFNDRYGLTEAVLSGRKTMTRRIVPEMVNRAYEERPHIIWSEEHESFLVFTGWDDIDPFFIRPQYNVGEIVAVAQRYSDIEEYNPENYEDVMLSDGVICEAPHPYSHLKRTPGWINKMFVRADLMPHHIRITSVRVERLQDISEFDCLREGIRQYGADGRCFTFSGWNGNWASSAREAFAALIDKVSGKGTWNSNPWVLVYEFELVK